MSLPSTTKSDLSRSTRSTAGPTGSARSGAIAPSPRAPIPLPPNSDKAQRARPTPGGEGHTGQTSREAVGLVGHYDRQSFAKKQWET
eukprot:4551878-Alexandrium_andersonii.AAC.1